MSDAHDLPWNEERLFKHSRQVGDVGSIHEEFGQLSSSLSNALNLEKREEEIRIFEFEELQSEQDPPGDILDVELLRFVQDPLKFFLERSLNLRVHREYAKEDRDWDPYQLTGLNRWKWVHRQFAQIGEEIDPTDLNDELHIESFGPFQGLETKRFEHQLSGLRNDNRLPTSLLPRAEEIKWYSRNHDALIRSHITFDNSRTWGVWIQGSGLKPFHTLRAWIHSALLFLSHEERGAWVVGLPDCSESELLQIRDVWSTQGAVDYLDGVFGWYYRGIKCPIVFEAKAGLSAAKKLWKMGIRELSNLESGIPPLSLGSYFLDMDGQLVPAIRQLFGSDFVQEFKLGGRYEYYYADFLRMALLLWGPSLRGSL